MLVDSDTFLAELKDLYAEVAEKGARSVWVTYKRRKRRCHEILH